MVDPSIYELSDRELVASAVRVEASPLFRDRHLRLSKWERNFIEGLPELQAECIHHVGAATQHAKAARGDHRAAARAPGRR